jgi:hypothetical protein
VKRLRQSEVTTIRQGRLDEAVGHTEVLVAVEECRARHLDLELLEDVGTRRVEVEAHVVEPVEVVRRSDAVLGEEAEDVALVDEFRDEVFALAALSGSEVAKDGIGEDVETSKNDGEGTVERLARSESAFDETRPADLNGDDDELSRVRFDPGEEAVAIESGGVFVERLKVLVGAGEELSQGDLHLRFELGKPVVDLRVLGEDDGSREADLFAFSRGHTLDTGNVVVEDEGGETGEHLLEELADADDLLRRTRVSVKREWRNAESETYILAVTDDLEQVFVSNEIEPRE